MRFARFAGVCCFLAAVLGLAAADDPDPTRAKIDKARAAFEADTKLARDELKEAIEQKLETARKAGDLDLVKKVGSELNLYSSQGVLPESVGTNVYKAAVRKARDRYAAVLKDAEKEYTKAGKIETAEAVRDDLLRVQSDAAEERSAELTKAVGVYHKARDKARDALLAGFTTQIDQAELQKADPARLRLERDVFEKNGGTPWSKPMRPYMEKYGEAYFKAESALRTAYLREVERATRAKDNGRADQLHADLLAAIEVRVVAVWRHQVNDDRPRRVRLYSNGCIDDPKGSATWTYQNGMLKLRWPNPKARGGAYVDTCEVFEDGTAYGGKNQDRARITGTNLAR